MTKDELKKLKQTVDYFGHWYDVIGEENVAILEKSVNYIAELEQENAELKENYFYTRCIRSNCPYIHKVNRNCTKFGSFFTAVSNGDCPMMKNLNANIKLDKAKELLKKWVELYKPKVGNIPPTPIQVETEQFINREVEK